MYVGSGFSFNINTQKDLKRAMVTSFNGFYDGGGVPELRHIEELIEAVQNEEELSHLTLAIPEVIDIIRRDQIKNLDPSVHDADIRNYITMFHILKGVPEYKLVMEGVQKSYNLYILNSNNLPSGHQHSSNVSIAVIPGKYEALWITGQEIDLTNSENLPSINLEFKQASERISRHASYLDMNTSMNWLHDFAPKDARVYEEKLMNILFGRPLNSLPRLAQSGPVIEHSPVQR